MKRSEIRVRAIAHAVVDEGWVLTEPNARRLLSGL